MELIKSILLAGVLFLILFGGRGITINDNLDLSDPSQQILVGEVQAKEGNVVHIATNEGPRQILLSPGTQIYKNDQPVAVENIQRGNSIALLNQNNNPIIRLSSSDPLQSAESINWFRIVVGVVGIAFILSIIFALGKLATHSKEVNYDNNERTGETKGIEAGALNFYTRIEKVMQRWSVGLQKLFQGGKSTIHT